MKFNLGSGDRYEDGWINVDHGYIGKKDQRVNLAGPLPWEKESVSYVYAGHLLEHLTKKECLELLTNLLPLMINGGKLMIVGPDIEKAREMMEAGTFDYTYHSLNSLLYGGHRWEGDDHKWETNEKEITELLTIAGWSEIQSIGISNVGVEWPVADRAPQWQYAILARKGKEKELDET